MCLALTNSSNTCSQPMRHIPQRSPFDRCEGWEICSLVTSNPYLCPGWLWPRSHLTPDKGSLPGGGTMSYLGWISQFLGVQSTLNWNYAVGFPLWLSWLRIWYCLCEDAGSIPDLSGLGVQRWWQAAVEVAVVAPIWCCHGYSLGYEKKKKKELCSEIGILKNLSS